MVGVFWGVRLLFDLTHFARGTVCPECGIACDFVPRTHRMRIILQICIRLLCFLRGENS